MKVCSFSKIPLYIILFSLGCLLAQGGDTLSLEKGLSGRDDIVFYGGFEESFNNPDWVRKWGIAWSERACEATIIHNGLNGGKSLRVVYPRGGVGPRQTGIQFPIVLNKIASLKKGFYQQLYLRYYVKFEKNFDFRRGGKLPGLMGGGDSWTRSGGNQPDGSNGWTLRFMWVDKGRLIVYAYVPPSGNGKFGSKTWGQAIDCDFFIKPGKWHCIEQFVDVGTPGNDDGKLKVWIDGTAKVDISDMRFRNVENNSGRIGGIYFSTFHGGNTPDWAPLHDSYIQFDALVLSAGRIGGMSAGILPGK